MTRSVINSGHATTTRIVIDIGHTTTTTIVIDSGHISTGGFVIGIGRTITDRLASRLITWRGEPEPWRWWFRSKVEVQLDSEDTRLSGFFVEGVADPALVRVDPGRWAAPGDAVEHLDGPDAEVDVGVVAVADQGQVDEVGSSAVAEEVDVVGIAS